MRYRRETMIGARRSIALASALLAVALPACHSSNGDDRPNVILIVTDDQTRESLPHEPALMPFLQSRMEDPKGHWITFSQAFVNTPMCCPSRATILTGQYSHHTGVQRNEEGHLLDESSTLATWLHDAGYFTGLFGKYLNLYPFDRGPYVPPGWDRWAGKINTSRNTVYYNYTMIEDGRPRHYGSSPSDYATDVLAAKAVDFITTAPADRPFFMMFTPSAPHDPWIPAPRDVGANAIMPIVDPPSENEVDVSDKPAWVRRLPSLTAVQLDQQDRDRRSVYETLLSVDDSVRRVLAGLRARGALGNTIVIYLTDNGFSFGEHRWVTKACEYEECIDTPFVVRYPGAAARVDDHLVSNTDVAPTIADLAGVQPASRVDGRSLVPLLDGRPPARWRSAVLIEWAGGEGVPPWWGLRTENLAYIELATGERELYDLDGKLGPPDPNELSNRATETSYAGMVARLSRRLANLRAA